MRFWVLFTEYSRNPVPFSTVVSPFWGLHVLKDPFFGDQIQPLKDAAPELRHKTPLAKRLNPLFFMSPRF